MKKPIRIGLWWVPFVLVAAPMAGWVPGHRDLIDFFVPMRQATASMLATGTAPWLNLANGCGEAWFANPETAVLYPPAWLHLVFRAPLALSLEIALHLAWLSLGAGLVARSLGAGRWGRLVVEVAAWSAGPVMATVGVLNNLETVAWLPWMVLAALRDDRKTVPLLAATTAMAWLGGEPQVWAVAVALVLLVAPRRLPAGAGIALGTAVVAVQLVPFLFWVIEGDRGMSAATWALRGGLTPADWSGLLVPGLPWNPSRMVYAESLFLGAALVTCLLLGAWRHKWVLAGVCALGFLATLPEIGGGDFFLLVTGGMVRYPSRFALVALLIVLPLVGKGVEDWLKGSGRWVALAAGIFSLILCVVTAHPWRWWVAGVPSVLLIGAAVATPRRDLRALALIAGLGGVVAAALPLLGLQRAADVLATEPVWPEAVDAGRLYSPTPSIDAMRWLATGLEPRRLWPVGYLNLTDQLTLVRTDSPVAHGRLAQHLGIVDQGPAGRWWLDALAANWVVFQGGEGVPDGMEEVRRQGGMRLLRNHRAMPVVSLVDSPPVADAMVLPRAAVNSQMAQNRSSTAFTAPGPAFLWVSLTPVEGWRWSLDGRTVTLDQGPGIVQFLPVEGGAHRLEGRYRPPGIIAAGGVSALAVLTVFFLLGRVAGGARPLHLIP